MAEAKVVMSEPVVEAVILTLTASEADLLMEFLGATCISVVEELLDWMPKDKQRDVNHALYNVFEALNKTLGKRCLDGV